MNGDEPVDVDRLIRRAAGREPPPEPKRAEPPEEAVDDETQQLWAFRAAAAAGFPTSEGIDWAVRRLRGRTREALEREARELLAICQRGRIDPANPERREPGTTADGGVRGVLPDDPTPSVDSIIRAAARGKRAEVWDEARNLDSLRPPDTNDND